MSSRLKLGVHTFLMSNLFHAWNNAFSSLIASPENDKISKTFRRSDWMFNAKWSEYEDLTLSVTKNNSDEIQCLG